MNALVWERGDYTLAGTADCYILALPKDTALIPTAVTLACGEQLKPGDTLTRLGGKHTSAVYRQLNFDQPLTYRGMYRCEDVGLLCFTQMGREAELSGVDFFAGRDCYYAWAWLPRNREFLFTTPTKSVRVIETEVFQR